ncbi:yippee putative zinc-binding protein [Dictyocaulus viviparus]|uniref:Protein yippee-like n=1 Tax=Dictyocaulus viviparus TaxID=29172 RepID=A0A0D8XT57_DICVI|nr:yippee putative zinc-binding protein [Dictyocaulus viviparus]
MGRIFIENHGGLRVIVCRFCKTYLTNRSELISSRFQAHHRDMTTGKHIVRDVMCRICHRKIGWMYEFAMEDSQRYKESRVILEKALIDEIDGFRDPAGALETYDQPPSSPKYETFGGRRGIHLDAMLNSKTRICSADSICKDPASSKEII